MQKSSELQIMAWRCGCKFPGVSYDKGHVSTSTVEVELIKHHRFETGAHGPVCNAQTNLIESVKGSKETCGEHGCKRNSSFYLCSMTFGKVYLCLKCAKNMRRVHPPPNEWDWSWFIRPLGTTHKRPIRFQTSEASEAVKAAAAEAQFVEELVAICLET